MGESVAFVGLGAMGAPMASRLIEAGFSIRVFNRTPERMQPFVALGAVACSSIAETVASAQFVVVIVSDDEATRDVLLGSDGAIANARAGSLIIGSSTNTPALARELAAAALARQLAYLDAPVSGSVPQARAGELVFMVGGDAVAFERAAPLFSAMGRMSLHVGASGAGATMKLINNMISGAAIAALAEAVALARLAQLDPEVVLQVLCEGAAGSRVTRTKIPKMYSGDFSPQFKLELMDKDLRYFLGLAEGLDLSAPISRLVSGQLQAARQAGFGAMDTCALLAYLEASPNMGAPPRA